MADPAFEIVHHGAVHGVTGSCHELRFPAAAGGPPQAGVLIDCGLFQGAETSGGGAGRDRPAIDFPLGHLRALLVTHVHIDHVGRIPHLFAAGFDGPIYCSAPSALLLPLVIEDALEVGATRDRALIERVMERLRARLRPLPYGRWQRIATGCDIGLEVRLRVAGHILGSAYVECRLTLPPAPDPGSSQGRRRHRIVFSGDLGASCTPLLPEPEPPIGCDTLVIESTYGDTLHRGRAERVRVLQQVLERALANRGTVIIPAFSIGRTQELLYEIEDIIHREQHEPAARGLPWNELEIVVDSPLAARFTRVYERMKAFWDGEARERVQAGRHPLAFEQLRTVDRHEDHLRIVEHLRRTRYPAIVLAASGMCAGGRVVNYLKALIGDPVTDIVFVGYQAIGTPGRAIQQYGPQGGWVELDGERHDIRAAVHTVSGYSAHADRADLLAFAGGMRRPPSEVLIVHGDDDAKASFRSLLQERLPHADIRIPVRTGGREGVMGAPAGSPREGGAAPENGL